MEPKFKSENYSNFGGMNTKISPYITDKTEFLKLYNFDFTMPGSLTKRPGTTLSIGTTVSGRISGLYEYVKLSGFSQIIVTANTNAYTSINGNLNVFKTGLLNNALFDFTTFVDRMFACNGQDYFKWDGINSTNYSLPPGVSGTITASLGASNGTGFTGIYIYEYGYLNDRGYAGPGGNGFTMSVAGNSSVILSGFTAPSGFGITAFIIYRTSANNLDLFEIGTLSLAGATFIDNNLPLTATPVPNYLWFTLTPRYLEIYNNQLFMGGFSSMLSTMWFSDVGEPEGVDPTFNIEVRTNDGDRITGYKSYSGNLMVFKENSYHVLSGDDPTTFLLRQISDQYGLLSNRAIATYENKLVFLDKKGIVEFNGANTSVISTKIEPIFLNMNIEAARDNAVAIHNRLRNEIWFGIPCNGSTFNNCTIVYDYSVGGLTVFEGFAPSSLSVMKGALPIETAFYGSYSGAVFNFGSTFTSDFGLGITCLAQTRFIGDMGKSVTEQYRRLYLDVKSVIGTSGAININLYNDYGTSIAINRQMGLDPFQSRIDFGIPAKSLSAEFSNYSATLAIRLHGYTFESRIQRAV